MNHIDQADPAAPAPTVIFDAKDFVSKADHEKELGKRDSRIAELEAQLATQTKRADSAEAQVAPAALDVLVAERQAIVDTARSVCGKDFKSDGKSAHAIRLEVVTKARPSMKFDGKDSAYIAGVFETLAASESAAASSHEKLAVSVSTPRADAATDKVGVAFDGMIKDLHSQFKENN